MPFDIQNLCGNGGSGGSSVQGYVKTVNGVEPGADGNVHLQTEKDLGAALMALNWSSYTARYNRYVAQIEAVEPEEGEEAPVAATPEEYLMAFATNGCRFVRATNGLHFCVTAVIASGMIARGYIYLPSDATEDCKAVGKVGNAELLKFSGTFDDLEAEICGLPVATRLFVRNNTGWIDVADGWQTDGDYTADASCLSTLVRSYLWTLPPGRYMLRLTDGTVYLQAMKAAGNTVKYRWLRILPDDGKNASTALYFSGSQEIELWAKGTINGGPFARCGGHVMASKTYVDTALAGKTSPQEARTIADEQILSQVTQPFNDALVGVRLCKFTEINGSSGDDTFLPGTKCLRLDIQNAEWLRSKWNSIERCEIHLMVNARKRGRGFHWWHPRNWNFVADEGEIKGNKLGYGALAGNKTCRNNAPLEVFPAVPDWMPNNGYMQTEVAVTYQDLLRGYALIYPEKYFLPMVKPTDIGGIETAGQWGTDIAIIGTENKNPHPLLCGWVLAVNGVELGLPKQAYRFGCSRHKHAGHLTRVSISNDGAKIENFYSSISTK